MPQVVSRFSCTVLMICCWMLTSSLAVGREDIVLNQLGFLPLDGKVAIVPDTQSGEFWLRSAATGSEVLRGPLSTAERWEQSGERVKVADFSAFNKPGDYYISVSGVGKSNVFTIGEGRYEKAIKTVAQSFYLHRAGVEIDGQFVSDQFIRAAGHPDILVYGHGSSGTDQTILSSPKGWYDAGDYNKYTVNAALAVYFLLQSYEHEKSFFAQSGWAIPESSNTVPDILDEALWGLEWLLAMQDTDGGVFQRLGSLQRHQGLPGEQTERRYVMAKSTGTALVFSAVMAHASRIFKDFDSTVPNASDRFLVAAEKAWQWTRKHPKVHFSQPPGVNSQLFAWANDSFADERLWAATQLGFTTGKRAYFKRAKLSGKLPELRWQHVGILGLIALLENEKAPSSLRDEARQALAKLGDELVRQYWRSAYLVPMEKNDFSRDSNFIAINRAYTLLALNRHAPRDEYVEAARGLMDYLLGRNPLAVSYVSGVGSRAIQNPRDWISQFDKKRGPLPGLLVSGPNASATESCPYEGKWPALKYSDTWCSEQTNSVSLAGGGALLYVLSHFRESPPQRVR